MFQLAMPWMLLLLMVPLLTWALLPKASLKLAKALYLPFYQTLLGFMEKEHINPYKSEQIRLFVLIWILLVFALSGPQWVGSPIPLTREGRNIMMALDLSGSMEIPDMTLFGRPVSRLIVVKKAAEQFVSAREGDKIGLILFGSQAYLQTPLTYDRNNVLQRIQDATVGLAGKTTSIGDALGLAVKRLQQVPSASRIVILLTDGANNSGVLPPLKAAQLAKNNAIKVYTIGLGADDASLNMNRSLFNNSDTALDETTLKKIASLTDGLYFRATDSKTLHEIYNTINQLETIKQDEATIRPQKNYYTWPLALALLLLIYYFFKKQRSKYAK